MKTRNLILLVSIAGILAIPALSLAQITGEIFNLLNDNTLQIFGQSNGFNAQVRRFGRRYQIGLRVAF